MILNFFFSLKGNNLPSQLIPIASFVASIPGRNSLADHELIFLAIQVPPVGSKSYYIEALASRKTSNPSISASFWNSSNPSSQITDLKISNEVSLTFFLHKKKFFLRTQNDRNYRWLYVKKRA